MTNFDIKVVSDTVCPWCFVGKQRLDKAIATYRQQHQGSADTFSITWFPFYLNPDAGKSVDKQAYYEEKFGKSRTAMMQQRMSEIGRAEGIKFKFGGRTGNTRDSHRLIQLAKTKSPAMQTRVIELLFASYFEEEKDITAAETLHEAAARAGLDASEIKAWMESDRGGPEVDKEVEDAYLRGISGVPNFTINGQYDIGGAQDPAAFVSIFEKIGAGKQAGPVTAGESC